MTADHLRQAHLTPAERAALNARVVHREALGAELAILRIAAESESCPVFVPGQFITLGLPRSSVAPAANDRVRLTKRPYSIASAASERRWLEFYVVRIDEGRFTPQLLELHEGDRLWLDRRAQGRFTLEPFPAGRNLLMIASGTGVAPFVAMLRTHRADPPWRRAVLLHGVRLAADLGYRPELEALAGADERFTYIPIASREPAAGTWSGLRGRVQIALDDEVFTRLAGASLAPAEWHAYLCGNPQMVDDVEQLLLGRGFTTHRNKQPGNIHLERYW